jgi:type VI secretion system protein ImpA
VSAQPILDVEGLLIPIDDASPCGTDPRLDSSPSSTYQVLKDARFAASDAERNIERGFAEESDAQRAEEAARKSWELIAVEGPGLIAKTAKDLEVTSWLAEALLRRHQLAGLRDGLRLLGGLVERYWDGVHPLPDEDGLETRLIPIVGLTGGEAEGRLITALRRVKLTEGGDSPFAFWQYERAASGNAAADATMAAIAAALDRSSDEFVRSLAEDARDCITAADQLEAKLKVHCADETPSFSRLHEALSGIFDAVKGRAPAMAPAMIEPAAADATEAELAETNEAATSAANNADPRHANGGLDREGAFRQLEELARFFRRTEPHSPTAYAIENLVRRGRMSFPDLVQELIDDGNVRRSYFVNAGIQPPPEGAGG